MKTFVLSNAQYAGAYTFCNSTIFVEFWFIRVHCCSASCQTFRSEIKFYYKLWYSILHLVFNIVKFLCKISLFFAARSGNLRNIRHNLYIYASPSTLQNNTILFYCPASQLIQYIRNIISIGTKIILHWTINRGILVASFMNIAYGRSIRRLTQTVSRGTRQQVASDVKRLVGSSIPLNYFLSRLRTAPCVMS